MSGQVFGFSLWHIASRLRCSFRGRNQSSLLAENWGHLCDCCCFQESLSEACLSTLYLQLSSQAQALSCLDTAPLKDCDLKSLREFYSETKWQPKSSTLQESQEFLGIPRVPSYILGTPSMESRRRSLLSRGITVSLSILIDRLQFYNLFSIHKFFSWYSSSSPSAHPITHRYNMVSRIFIFLKVHSELGMVSQTLISAFNSQREEDLCDHKST